jgi:hypothetical protein
MTSAPGGGPLTADVGVPPLIRLLRSPLGRIIVRVPENPRLLGRQLAGLGHAASVDAGRYRTAGISQPTLVVYGTADPVGSVETWRRFVGGSQGASWRWWMEEGTWSGTTTPAGSAHAWHGSLPAERPTKESILRRTHRTLTMTRRHLLRGAVGT